MMMWMMMMMNCFCGMVDWRKAFSVISSRDHCQRSSSSLSYMPRVGSVDFFRKDHFSNIFRTGKVYKKQRLFSEAVAQRCSVEMVLLEISQNSQENTCARLSFLIKLQASGIIKCLVNLLYFQVYVKIERKIIYCLT